jgi:hypothetical protein
MDPRRHAIPAALAALALAAPAALAALPGGAKYVGTTSDGSAVMVRLTGNAKNVKRMRISYVVHCDNGGSGRTYTDIAGASVHRDRTFSMSGTYTGRSDGSKNRFSVSGKLTAKKAHGKFSLKSTGKGGKGKKKVTCTTGKLTWSAARS